jgi:hypothetical protein
MTGANRWRSNPTHKLCCSAPPIGSRLHKAASPVRSAAVRTPRKCASRGPRPHPRGWNAGLVRKNPYARASLAEPRGMPRRRAGFPARSVGRTPWLGIVRCSETSAASGRRDNARQSARTRSRTGNPSAARTASYRRLSASPPRKRAGETGTNFKSTPP